MTICIPAVTPVAQPLKPVAQPPKRVAQLLKPAVKPVAEPSKPAVKPVAQPPLGGLNEPDWARRDHHGGHDGQCKL